MQSFLPNSKITNFSSHWRDGRALLSLIHEIKPDKAPPVSSLDPRKNLSNCTLAIRTAKIYLKVPPIITPEDLVSGELDELSMMTYISYFVKPAAKAVLKWAQEMLPQMKITDLTTDWNNGIALAGLLNNLFPGLFPKWKTLSPQKGEENLQQVFDIAKTKCGIEPNLSPKEMSDPLVEELHVMTYLLRMKNSNLLSLPEHIDISGLGIKEAKLGRQTHFFVDTTQAGSGNIFISAFYEDETAVKFVQAEKRPGILKIIYTPEKPGKLHFNILWSGVPVPGSPFVLRVSDTSTVRILDREDIETTIHVNSRVMVRLDATAIEHGSLAARLMYTDSPPLSPEVTNDNGIYTIEFVPVTVGTPTLRFYWDKEELKNCSLKYTVLDMRQYHISHLPRKNQFYTFDPVSFVVESREGLPLHPLKMAAICDEIHIPFQFNSIKGSTGEAMFVPTLPGTYRIEISCVNRLVEGSPFTVKVIDPSKCQLITKPPKYLALNSEFELLMDIKEAGPGDVEFKSLDVTNAFESVTQTNQSVASIKIVPKMLGEYMVSLYHCGSEVPGCPLRLTVCDPSSCSLSGEVISTKTAVVGKPVFVSIKSPSWTELKPVLKAQGSTARYPVTLEEKSQQEFVAHFIPWEIGGHTITVTLGGFPIPNTPCEFDAVTSASTTCSATGSGLQQALTGIPAQFLVHATSGLLDEGNLNIQVQSVVSGYYGKVRVRDNENSSYNVAYLVDTPGAYLVHVKTWDRHIPGSPFKVTVSYGPQAHNCVMTGTALDPNFFAKIGEPIEFSVDGRKAGNGTLNVTAMGPKGAQARVFTAKGSKSGLYDIQLDPIRPGKYRISVKWSGEHVPNSPFLIRIFPGADASKCKAYGPGLEDGLVGQPSTFTIETRDAGSGVLKVRLNGIRNAFKVDVKPISTQNVRTLIAKYNPTKPGDYLISIKWSERDVPGSPFKVRIGGDEMNSNEEEERRGSYHRVASPGITELDTIREDYEGTESQFSLDGWNKKQRHQNSHRQQQPILPSSSLANNMPMFSRGHGISYQNNFATKGARGTTKGGGGGGGGGERKGSGHKDQGKKRQFNNERPKVNGKYPIKPVLKK